ncbi:hypothetical protein ACWDYK_34395 [Streptomyces anthocyanicus]
MRGFLDYWRLLRRREQHADSLDDPILQALQAGGAPLDIKERPTEDKPDRVAFKLNDKGQDRIGVDSDSAARILSVHGLKPDLAQARPVSKEQERINARLEELEAWFKEHPGKAPVIPPGDFGIRNEPEELRDFYHWWVNLKYHGLVDSEENKPFVEILEREGVRISRRVKRIQKIFLNDTPWIRVPLGERAKAAIIALHRARAAGPGGEAADSPGAGEDLVGDAMEIDEGTADTRGGESPGDAFAPGIEEGYADESWTGAPQAAHIPAAGTSDGRAGDRDAAGQPPAVAWPGQAQWLGPGSGLAVPEFRTASQIEATPGLAGSGATLDQARMQEMAETFMARQPGLSTTGWSTDHLIRLWRQTDEVFQQDRAQTFAAILGLATDSGEITRQMAAHNLSEERVTGELRRQSERQHRQWPVTAAEAPLLWTIATTSGGQQITAVQLAAELRNRRTTPTAAVASAAGAPGEPHTQEGGQHGVLPEDQGLDTQSLQLSIHQRAEAFLNRREDLRSAGWTTEYLVGLWQETNRLYLQALEQYFGQLPDLNDPLTWHIIRGQGLWQVDDQEATLLWTIAATGTQPTPQSLANTLRTHRTTPATGPTPTVPPTIVLRAETQNHDTDILNHWLLNRRLRQLPEGSPEHHRIHKALRTLPTSPTTRPSLPQSFLDEPRPTAGAHHATPPTPAAPTPAPAPAPAPAPLPEPPAATPTETATKTHPLPWESTPALERLLSPADATDETTLDHTVKHHRTELADHIAESIADRLRRAGIDGHVREIHLDITTFPGNDADLWLTHVLPQLPKILGHSVHIALTPERDLHLCPPE